jgi:hypothetical protein
MSINNNPMASDSVLAGYITPNSKGAYDADAVHAVTNEKQFIGGSLAAHHAKDPRERAAIAIAELAATQAGCEINTSTLLKACDKLSSQAERTKTVAIQSAEKMRVAYDRLVKTDLEKIEKFATAAERLVSALDSLGKFSESGKLSALIAVLEKKQ